MSLLPKNMDLPDSETLQLRGMPGNDRMEIKGFMKSLTDKVQNSYRLIRDHMEAGGMATANWVVREATAVDVANDEALAVGNLIVVHRDSGSKFEHEA